MVHITLCISASTFLQHAPPISSISTLRQLSRRVRRIPHLLLRRRGHLLGLLGLPQLVQIMEPRMLQGGGGGDAHLRAQLQHGLQQLQADLINLRQDGAQVLGGVDMEVGPVLREGGDAGPGPLRRRAHQPEDLLQLVLVRGAGEERPARVHLRHDAAGGPDVDACVISTTA